MTQKQWVIAGGGVTLVLIIIGMLGLYTTTPTETPQAPLVPTAQSASSTDKIPEQVVVPSETFTINPADTIASWSFTGAYSGNESLIAQARADIEYLTGLIGKGQYDDYDLYNGIANDYGMLGEGKAAYENYNKAIRIHSQKGLAFVNLAHLMSKLGMYHTATDAYTKAVTVEPKTLEYHIERVNYLTRQFGSDNALIMAAFADASKQFGDAASVLTVKAQWLAEQRRYAEALKVWQTVKALSLGTDTSAIDTEIARLQSKI